MDGNTTDYWMPHSRPRRHISYISGTGLRFSCHVFSVYPTDSNETCHYVKTEESCGIIVNFINYLEIMICHLNLNDGLTITFLTLVVVSILCFMVFVTGKYFMVPNMFTMMHASRFTEYTFGFSVLSALLQVPFLLDTAVTCKTHSAVSAMYLAEWISMMFAVLTLGFVIISSPREVTYRVRQGRFCWNTFMMYFGLLTLFYLLLDGNVNDSGIQKGFTLSVTSLYIGYIIYLWKSEKVTATRHRRPSLESDEYEPTRDYRQISGDPWEIFYKTISPYGNRVGSRGYFFLLLPFWIVIALFVPVVTKTRPLNGWCKITTLINCILFPVLFYTVPSIKMYYFIVVMCLMAIVFIVLCTRLKYEPPFHTHLATIGFIAGVYVVVNIDNEIRCLIWQVISFFLDWRVDSVFIVSPIACVVILTVLLDALVKKDYRDMAYGITVGCICILTFFAYPVIAFLLCFRRVNMTPITANTYTTCIFLFIALSFNFVSVSFTDYEIRRSHGILMGILYIVFIIFVIFSAFQLIHPFGSYHSIFFAISSESDWA